jgi:hypothetical protein
MNFPSFYNLFCIKNQFLYSFLGFYYPLDWASIFRKTKGLGATKPNTQNPYERTAGCYYINRGPYLQSVQAEGVWSDHDHRIRSRAPGLNSLLKQNGTHPRSSDQQSTPGSYVAHCESQALARRRTDRIDPADPISYI